MNNYILKTTTLRLLPFQVLVYKLSWENVCFDKSITSEFCLNCKMYNKRGGCPPNSPEFGKYIFNRTKNIYLIMFKVPLDIWTSKKVSMMKHISQVFLYGSGFVEVVIKSVEKGLVRYLRGKYEAIILPSSYCMICNKCELPITGKCTHPKERMFSPESLGVLVDRTIEKSGIPERLEWFAYGSPDAKLPIHIRKVIFLCSDQEFDETDMQNQLSEFHNLTKVTRRSR